ncbi:unnamed protein product [Amoebophrya sp. A25]|nr:unnamed protein product [Amoebophrya sp. A25]|eukprot:GSA25T00010008001.1
MAKTRNNRKALVTRVLMCGALAVLCPLCDLGHAVRLRASTGAGSIYGSTRYTCSTSSSRY